MSFRKKIGVMVASTGLAQLSLIVTGVVAARGLGPEDRGYYAVLTLVPLVLSQVSQLGIPIAVTYFLASDGGVADGMLSKLRRIVSTQALTAVAIALVTVLVLRHRIDGNLILPALLMVPAIVGLIVQEYAYAVLQGLDRFGHVAVARLFPAVVYALIAGALWFGDAVSLATMSGAWAIAYCLSALLGIVMIRRIGLPRSKPGTARSTRELMRFGARAFVGTVAPMDVFRFDQILGSILLTPVSLGIYVVSAAFSSLPKIVAANVGHVVYVDTANRIAVSRSHLSALVGKVVRLSLLGAIPCLVLIALLPMLNDFMFGAEFADAALPSQILVAAAWISGVRRLVSEFAKGVGKPEVQAAAEVTICGVVAVFAFALCPIYGYTGLAVAVGVSQMIVLLLSIGLLMVYLRRDGIRT